MVKTVRIITLFILALSLSTDQSLAQNKTKKDSLFQALQMSGHDTSRVLTLLELAIAHRYSPSDSLLIFIQKALDISEKTNYIYGQARAHQYFTKAYLERGDYDKTKPSARAAIRYFKKIKDDENIGITYTLLGRIEMEKSNLDSAAIFIKKALVYYKKIKSDLGISRCITNMGRINLRLKNYSTALEYFQENYDLIKNKEDKTYIAIAFNNIASAYDGLGNKEKTKEYIDRAYAESIKTPNREFSATLLVNLSEIAFEDGYKELALRYLEEAWQLEKQTQNLRRISYRLYNLGEYYRRTGEDKQAKNYYLRSLVLADSLDLKLRQRDNYSSLSEVYSNIGNYKKALDAHRLFKVMNDSIFNEKTHQQIADIQVKYETEKKEQKIKLLNAQKQMQALEISKKNTMLLFSFLIIAATSILSILLYIQYKNKNRAYIELVRKNLEEVKKEQLERQPKAVPILNVKQNSPAGSFPDAELIEKMKNELEIKKIYLDTNLTIDIFAKKIDSNRTYLSKAISEYYGHNFHHAINELRVKEARSLLSKPENNYFTIAAIAEMAGFNSTISFNRAFKKYTGLTPSFYRKHIGE